jgi:hypothetical protein
MVNQEAQNGVITRDVPEDVPEEQKQDMAANMVIGEVLAAAMGGGEQAYTQGFSNDLLARGFTAGQFWNILSNMSQQLPNVPYDYCLPEPFEPPPGVDPDREKRPEPDNHYKRPDPEGGWLYYGRPYDLDLIDTENDTRLLNNGVVPFTDEVYSEIETGQSMITSDGLSGKWSTSETVPAAALPLFFVKHTQEDREAAGGSTWTCTRESDPDAPMAFRGVVKSDPLYRYSWDLENVHSKDQEDPDTAAVQSTLYEGSYAISFAYGKNVGRYVNNYLQPKEGDSSSSDDFTSTRYSREVVVGLHPGGEGTRTGSYRDIFDEVPSEDGSWSETFSMFGLEGQPGEGEPREFWDAEWEENELNRYNDTYPYYRGDLSREFGEEIPEINVGGDPAYLIITEKFGYIGRNYGDSFSAVSLPNGGGDGFDLTDSGLVFMPDPLDEETPEDFHKYTAHYIPGELVVDRISDQRDDADFKGALADGLKTTVMDRAITNYYGDAELRAFVDAGGFTPGEFQQGTPDDPEDIADFPGIENWSFEWTGDYKYGLQTVGGRYGDGYHDTLWTSKNSVDHANADGFLAYMTQEDEHVLNQAIYNLARDIDKYDIKMNTIGDQDRLGQIKAYDAWYAQVADAQAGRVVRDRQGNLVRTQQYILRPDAQTVQVLNVSMRTGDAGNLAGLSTMDFTTTFTGDGYPLGTDLRNLPWTLWLNTQGADQPGADRWVFTGEATHGIPELASMYAKFTNPVSESLMESRGFGPREPSFPYPLQRIHSEQLALSSLTNGDVTYGFDADNDPLAAGGFGIGSIGYGFSYTFDGGEIPVNLYQVRDDSGAQMFAQDIHAYRRYADDYDGAADMWDALRVAEPGGPLVSPDTSLEIAIDQDATFFSAPIDNIYVPMSHMAWRNYAP